MNSMNDQRFFDLAMKVIARQANDAERADVDALLADKPELRAEFMRLEADARVAKDALPIVNAMRETKGELPAYARGRLRTMVRQTLGRPESAVEPDRSLAWGWRWVLGLAAATAVVVIVALSIFHAPNAPVIQLAMLDTVGGTRGTGTNELVTLQEAWKGSPVQTFSNASELQAWEQKWPNDYGRTAAKIIYDPAAGEIRVSGHSHGKPFQKTFPLEKDLATTLQQVSTFVREQTQR
ncbi:MAG TPA: hypothetical protein VNY07_12785 [Chthoniobacterales bacterium]|jgi:hypothetical protein|nr:hypothetical protein [Chthoniobacterales bacterium]